MEHGYAGHSQEDDDLGISFDGTGAAWHDSTIWFLNKRRDFETYSSASGVGFDR